MTRSDPPAARSRFLAVQAITFARVPLIFVFFALSLSGGQPPRAAVFALALAAMLASAATDLVDGWLARRWGVVSRLGAYADPMVDKVYYLTVLPTLIWLAARTGASGHARLLTVLAVLFLLRDQWVTFLRSLGALHGVRADANWSGKARTAIAFPTTCVIYYFLQAPADWPRLFPEWLVRGLEIASAAVNVVSIVVYTGRYRGVLAAELSARPGPPPAGGTGADGPV